MNILITGGGGSVGTYLTSHFLAEGHNIRVLDPQPEKLQSLNSKSLEIIKASTLERAVLTKIVTGVDAVIHCAWSFSDSPEDVFQRDIGGLINLLTVTAEEGVKTFCNLSSAIVYGLPVTETIAEEHPCLVERARKPVYALGKLASEKLCAIYAQADSFSCFSIRFWWGFAEEIGGKHLREMIKAALEGQNLEVPAGAGGSFLHFSDLAAVLSGVLQSGIKVNGVYNLASFYATWEEIATMIKEIVGWEIEVIPVPRESWQGSTFLADRWELATGKAQTELGFKEKLAPEEYKNLLRQAIKRCAEKLV